ncbi:MAG TPA: NnrS family protein [Myxococcota bacterium]|nr:NnrS family protein [Myxococcota bacterium]
MRIDRYLSPEPVVRHAPIWALGFRPFFLLAALLVALWLPLWLGIHLGGLGVPLVLDPGSWHAHELLFGFAGAVLAGFLLTAARNWTKGEVPTGRSLMALVLLWVAGRLLMLLGGDLPLAVVAIVTCAFLPAVAVSLMRTLVKAKNRRNYAFPILLLVMGGFEVALFALDFAERRALLRASLDVVVVFLVVMGGRVIPFFTRNALKDATVSTPSWLAWGATISTAALIPAGLLFVETPLVPAVVALVAGALNLARLSGWASLATRRNALLWVLHLGYLWVGLGLVLRGLSVWVPELGGPSLAHSLAIGALGTLVVGMMARVALGHTGRPLVAPRLMVAAFVLPTVAALLRVGLPVVSPDLYSVAMTSSGVAMSVAFLLFAIVYAPILTRPRVDGAPG